MRKVRSSIGSILQQSYVTIILSLTVPLAVTLLVLLLFVHQYNGVIDRIDCAVRAQNILEEELPGEIWNIVSGRKSFDAGEQDTLQQSLDGLLQNM